MCRELLEWHIILSSMRTNVIVTSITSCVAEIRVVKNIDNKTAEWNLGWDAQMSY